MRIFMFSLTAIGLLLLPACSFRSSTSEADVSPTAPTPISDPSPVAVEEEIERAVPVERSQVKEPEFALDPAPAPPTESSSSEPVPPAPEPSSAEEVFNSVVRVLQSAVEGERDEAEADSTGSVFGSIGRALSKGFQEAVAGEQNVGDE